MSFNFFDEDGLKFLQRNKLKPLISSKLSIIDSMVNDNLSGQITEIYSSNQTYATESLLTMIAYCILSEEEEGIPLGGHEMNIFYFDIDHKFNFWRFIQILEGIIKDAVGNHFNKTITDESELHEHFEGSTRFEEILYKCLGRMKIYRCKTAFKFWMTLEGLLLSENINISVIFIDSLNTFQNMDKKSSELASNCLIKLATEHGISIFASKLPTTSYKTQEYSQQKEFMDIEWCKNLRFRLILESNSTSKLFDLKNKLSSVIYKFQIMTEGISFEKK
eukprot:gene5009-8607_t